MQTQRQTVWNLLAWFITRSVFFCYFLPTSAINVRDSML